MSEENQENKTEKVEAKNTDSSTEQVEFKVVDSEKSTSEDESSNSNELQQELDKYKKEYLYLRAEFDNYRKNVLKDREQQHKYGSETVLRDFLNILDNFKLAIDIEVNEDSLKSFEQGVRMIAKEFESTLDRNGVKKIEAIGKIFDPATQEALAEEESAEHEPGTVVKEFKGAYKLHDKLLRPGQVIVAKEKTVQE